MYLDGGKSEEWGGVMSRWFNPISSFVICFCSAINDLITLTKEQYSCFAKNQLVTQQIQYASATCRAVNDPFLSQKKKKTEIRTLPYDF